MTFVKICGIKDERTLEAARGADAVGFVVDSPKSHRDLTHEQAAALVRRAGPFQVTVAVTASREADALDRIVRDVRPHALQAPRGADLAPLRKAFPMLRLLVSCRPEDAHLVSELADAIVLDAATLDGYGGSGRRTDWNVARVAREAAAVPVILAGGLVPESVRDAIRLVKPYGVDVSSGVETEQEKDAAKIGAFVAAAKEAA